MAELKRIIEDSEILQASIWLQHLSIDYVFQEDDGKWPEPDKIGRQELEILLNNQHISFTTGKIGCLADVNLSSVRLFSSFCYFLFLAERQ